MIDAELIARVLEGRATPAERARVLAEADKSPELLALLSDSAAAMGADQAKVVPIRPRSIRTSYIVGIAAVLVAAVTLPRYFAHPKEGPDIAFDVPNTPAAIAAARSGPSAGAIRGGADAERRAQSATAGVRLVDYITLGSDSARATAAVEIAAALRAIPGGSIVAGQLDALAPPSREMIDAIEKVVDVHAFRAAGAAELLRLAAEGADERVLRGTNLRGAFDGLANDPRLSDEARAIATRVQTHLAQGSGRDELAALASDLIAILKR